MPCINTWSIEALAARRSDPKAKLIIEHGTPRTVFAKMIYRLYHDGKLTEELFDTLIAKHYRLAVLTKAEDQRLNAAGLRSKMLETAEARWDQVEIRFPSLADKPNA